MPSPSLEDRIRELCAKVVRASDPQPRTVLEELRAAVREYCQQLKQSSADKPWGLVNHKQNGKGDRKKRAAP